MKTLDESHCKPLALVRRCAHRAAKPPVRRRKRYWGGVMIGPRPVGNAVFRSLCAAGSRGLDIGRMVGVDVIACSRKRSANKHAGCAPDQLGVAAGAKFGADRGTYTPLTINQIDVRPRQTFGTSELDDKLLRGTGRLFRAKRQKGDDGEGSIAVDGYTYARVHLAEPNPRQSSHRLAPRLQTL